MEQEPACECTAPGFCPRYQIQQDAMAHGICTGQGLPGFPCTPGNSMAYRKKWRRTLLRRQGQLAGPRSIRSPQVQRLPVTQLQVEKPKGKGPGDHLKDTLAEVGLGVGGCQCESRIAQMNQWGIQGCEANRDIIVSWLREEQAKRGWLDRLKAAALAVKTGLVLRLNVLDPIPGIVDEAIHRTRESLAVAISEQDYTMPLQRHLKWAYGVTTVPRRMSDLLPRTLASLAKAGFDKPRLFVDGCTHELAITYKSRFGLEVVNRDPTIRTFGNWMLALVEMYIREPDADRYAIFQDDMVAYRNLRAYLDSCEYPKRGYWNLYTFPSNQRLAKAIGQTGRHEEGWYESNQQGKGAVGLVFNRETALTLMTAQHTVERPQDSGRGHKAIDGGIVDALRKAGWKEYVHNPSLIQHTGKLSSMRNHPHPQAISFRGEDYDALEIPKSDSYVALKT